MEKIVQLYLDEFFRHVTETYKIPKTELKKLVSIKKKKKMVSADPMKKLLTLTKADLIKLCKEKNINAYGTKFEMAQRIISSEKKGVIQEIKHHIPMIYITKDEAGDHIHEETRLIFDPIEKRVVAKKSFDGKKLPLSYHDVQICLKYKFKYLIPENLTDNLSYNESKEEIDNTLRKRLDEIEKEIIIEEDEEEEEEED
jgi:hypothetical protein